MGDYLDGCWAKLDRAKEHLESLELEVTTTFAEMPPEDAIRVRLDFEEEVGCYVVRVAELPKAPFLRWGVIIGDFLHSLRSVLDYLAYQLVATGDTPGVLGDWKKAERVAFPISDGPRSKFLEGLGPKLPGVPYPLLAIVESEQPYATYHDLSLSPMRMLRDLSNKDKHVLVTPVHLASETPAGFRFHANEDVRITGAWPNLWFPYEVGTPIEVVTVEIVGPNPQVTVDGDMTFYVAIDKGGHASVFLGSMLGCVTRILERFEPFFDALP